MKNILTFEEFILESNLEYINENRYATKISEENPSDCIPFDTEGREAYKNVVNVFADNKYTSITYYDISRAISKSRLTKEIYDREKPNLFRSVPEIWDSLSKLSEIVTLSTKAPSRSGYFDFPPENGKVGIDVYNQIYGRGDDKSIKVDLTFNIPNDENHDYNEKTIRRFIKENCFN
jgi:hypothetical protein